MVTSVFKKGNFVKFCTVNFTEENMKMDNEVPNARVELKFPIDFRLPIGIYEPGSTGNQRIRLTRFPRKLKTAAPHSREKLGR